MAPGYYGCNACLRTIASTDPRIHCLDCDEYDLCANCAVGTEEFPGGHLVAHRTCVFRRSGGGAHPPVVSSTAIVYVTAETVQAPVRPISPPLTAHASPDSPRPSLPQDSAPLPPTPPSPPVVQSFSPPPVQSPAPVPPVLPARQTTIVSSLASAVMPVDTSPTMDNFVSTSAHIMSPRDIAYDVPPPQVDGNPAPQMISHSVTGSVASQVTMPPREGTPVQLGSTINAQAQFYVPPPLAQTIASTSEAEVSAYTMPPRSYEPPTQATNSVPRYEPPPRVAQPGTPPPPPVPPPPPSAWGPFFNTDMTPTPVFMELIDAIFTYLDTRRTGNLTPEVYSQFLINQGYVGPQNIWNSNLVASMGKTKEESADAALKRAFDLFGIQYILRPRVREATSPPADVKGQLKSFGASFTRALSPATPAGGTMPLLTRAGFLNITAVEVLCDPARHYGGLARVVQMYDLGAAVRAWGPLPRGVLPDEPDVRMLDRVARVQAAARERQSGQVRMGSAGASAAGGLRSAASFARSAVNKIDAKDVVNTINAVGDAAYIVSAVTN
ncbi:Nudix [Mycena venus]|uniref:Nudix n=1 Tax=Mycena venus TaxID=2733690 RepID=A0A8H6XL08_9AGAR|nr:Nudix [Mycena venus]